MRNFKSLLVWQKAHNLTLMLYRSTGSFPKEELYGLTSQIRRAASSIPTNIAEGCGRQTDGELLRFMYIGMGSASELEYQLILAHDLSYLSDADYNQMSTSLIEVRKMMNAFIQKLKRDIEPAAANR